MSLIFDEELNCFKLHKTILIDNKSIQNIINLQTLYDFNNFDSREDIWYVKNIKLHKLLFTNINYDYIEFKNDNKNDFRLTNINFKFYDIKEPSNVDILEKGKYIKLNEGKYSGQIRNMYWKVKDNNNDIYYLMSCKDNNKNTTYFKFDTNSLHKVLNVYNNNRYTWHIGKNGYPKVCYPDDKGNKINRYLHQHLMDYYGNGLNKNTKTIDHINRDKLDNRLSNLRLATQSQQNQNTDKRKRQSIAQDLPSGITQTMLPKYVCYYNECYNKEKNLYRQYFRIEGHPKLDKDISSSKSNKISIQDKLTEIKQYLKNIEENKECVKEMKELPVGIRLKKKNDEESFFILDYRIDNNRFNLKMKVNKSKSYDENYDLFKKKVINKYPNYEV
tara:strand:- start:13047 stop:14210 length:1164 start_codon:yes stop_codon:yes gene_type:complete